MGHHDEEGGDQGREDAAQDNQGHDPSVMDRKHEKRRKMPPNICWMENVKENKMPSNMPNMKKESEKN